APPTPARHLDLVSVADSIDAVSSTAPARTIDSSQKSGRDNGIAYRGTATPALQGHYVYIENGLLMAEYSVVHTVAREVLMPLAKNIHRVVEGDDGEVYLQDDNGNVYRLRQTADSMEGGAASLLSQTGCFLPGDPSAPAPGLIPYAPASPLWSDNAVKRRWIAMPDWDTPDTQITVLPDGNFEFPNGTVLIKEFRLGDVIAETRLLVKGLDGNWTGYSYEWNAEQTDATLLSGGKTTVINGQTWEFPSPFVCFACHTAVANVSLGPEIAQLNSDYYYSDTALTANQLTTFDSIGLIAGGLSAPVSELDALPDPTDTMEPLDERARGYLHANCASCHQPSGPGFGPMDLRYFIAGESMGAADENPMAGDLGIPGAKILVRGNPDLSMLLIRMLRLDFARMPILGTEIVDPEGTALVSAWINSGLGFGVADSDADQKTDDLDNCSAVANPLQRDTDGDGFGNFCDPDLDNNGVVNFLDVSAWVPFFNTVTSGDADFNGDGLANFGDFVFFADYFLQPPGPGSVSP
ncbi:MAG: hypothetical protein HKN70_02025, partial [Gammaproteobacteria bacterium]|nr:hypothetical protein [Gammaproteobacteria bacterium]